MNLQPETTQLNKPKRKTKRGTQTLIVRMYDVGFGDCFLLLIPKKDGKNFKILFDCGSIKLGQSDTPIKKVAERVINDLRDSPEETPWIDVLVVTHRHKDHISGFDDPAWAEVEVGEVWMPWTEKPDDPNAQKIRELHTRLAENLESRLNKSNAENATNLGVTSSLAMAINALSNEGALRTLFKGFSNEPIRRYLPEENATTSSFTSPLLPDVTISVLGPSRDPEVIREMDPPAGQSYLKMINSGSDETSNSPLPFRKDWIVIPDDYQVSYTSLFDHISLDDREALKKASLNLDMDMASMLDKALNGTSLVLVLQIGKAVLLFSGDAQWGTWRLALENQEFRKLLETVTFYKVGHHGSHNATPVEFVQNIMGKNGQKVLAMISVNATSNWPMVPKEELVAEMQNKEGCKIARSDRPAEAEQAGFTLVSEGVIEAKIPF